MANFKRRRPHKWPGKNTCVCCARPRRWHGNGVQARTRQERVAIIKQRESVAA